MILLRVASRSSDIGAPGHSMHPGAVQRLSESDMEGSVASSEDDDMMFATLSKNVEVV